MGWKTRTPSAKCVFTARTTQPRPSGLARTRLELKAVRIQTLIFLFHVFKVVHFKANKLFTMTIFSKKVSVVVFILSGVQTPPRDVCWAAHQGLLQEDGWENSGGSQEVLCAVVHEYGLLKASGKICLSQIAPEVNNILFFLLSVSF